MSVGNVNRAGSLRDLVLLDLRAWSDLGLWIGEGLDGSTRAVNPREWVAPIHYDMTRPAHIKHKERVVYHPKRVYEGVCE